jgi:hypothetical protein
MFIFNFAVDITLPITSEETCGKSENSLFEAYTAAMKIISMTYLLNLFFSTSMRVVCASTPSSLTRQKHNPSKP